MRQRVLISAFTRALKDPFPPARIAGILALSATQQYYLLSDVAFKILPALVSCTMDPEKQVRDQAFKAVKGFLDNLEKASENPERIAEMESQVNANSGGGLISSESVPQWANWAFSALSSKFYKPPQKVPQETPTGIQNVKSPSPDAAKTLITVHDRNVSPGVAKDDKEVDDTEEGWGDMEDLPIESKSSGGWDVDDEEPWESLDEQKNVNK